MERSEWSGRGTHTEIGANRAPGAAFWLQVMTELQSRGVEDILITLIDGLTGFPDAIHAVFPQAQMHHCVVHLVRRSLAYVPHKDRKLVAAERRRSIAPPRSRPPVRRSRCSSTASSGRAIRPWRRSGTATGSICGRPSPIR